MKTCDFCGSEFESKMYRCPFCGNDVVDDIDIGDDIINGYFEEDEDDIINDPQDDF